MQYQRTLEHGICVEGVDLPSGNPSRVHISPAGPNTGIVFSTQEEKIRAILDNAYATTLPIKTLILQGENDRIAFPEHLLPQLSAYGIDNAFVEIEKTPSLTSRLFYYIPFGSAKHTHFVPEIKGGLCGKLEGNVKEQDEPRKILRLKRPILTPYLMICPIGNENIEIHASTRYKLAGGNLIEQERELVVSPEAMKEISIARSYCGTFRWAPRWLTKSVACFFYLSHGFGNGNDSSNVFYPAATEKEWRGQELMPAELACHAIMDRRGELALLPGRVQGVRVVCKFAGHKHVVDTLKANRDYFIEE